ncbi:MAG: hypothetical protein RLZ98_360 [Pseudomonadota bacterium]|jgi:nitrite reductase/ring-hydroxylating ferredoxin subunit
MLSREDNDLLCRVGPGTPMGRLMRRYWIPVLFTSQLEKPDCPPVRVKILGENLVAFRDTEGRVGLIDEACPHRTASMFFGRNEEGGLRCVYHGIKFDVAGNCTDIPCLPPDTEPARLSAIKQQMRIKSYPCIERGDLVWAYMGPAELKPEFPDLEWVGVPKANRFVTRHIQQCNWLQGLDGGFDSSHLTFLHSGQVDLRRGNTDQHRRIVPSYYEVLPMDFGFVCAGGRDIGGGNITWHADVMLMPFHKIIPSVPRGAHVWAPIDDENTMLYSINFKTEGPLTAEEMEREYEWRGIHTENLPGSDYAIQGKHNDYLIDRELQASGRSFTGIRGLGAQDCGMQESMGAIADRTKEHLLVCDAAVVKIRRLLLQTVRDHEAGKPPPGLDPQSYRVRSLRFEAPSSVAFADAVEGQIRIDKVAAE